jgi:hypothetical protein
MAAYTRCFTINAGLALFDGLATLNGLTRLMWVRLRYGSRLRLPGLRVPDRSDGHARSATWLTGHSRVNSFQLTRQERFH